MDYKYSSNKNEIEGYASQHLAGTDYMWFLVTLCDYFDKKYELEVLDDKTGDTMFCKMKDFELTPGETDSITFNLFDKTKKENVTISTERIRKVEENRLSTPGSFYKYYIYSETGDYRFLFRCTENRERAV